MATIKVFSLGGLDQKSNDLTRASDKASDMLNMEYDTQSNLKSRSGYEPLSIDGSTSVIYDDIVHFNYTNEDLCFTQNALTVKIINKTTLVSRTANLPSGFSLTGAVSISSCENQNCLYFTNSTDETYVAKYDGSNIYRAGLPTPRRSNTNKIDSYATYTGTTTTGFTRILYTFKDITGNLVYSPYVQTTVSPGGSSVLNVNTFKTDDNCRENGFLDKYCYISKYGTASQVWSKYTIVEGIGGSGVGNQITLANTDRLLNGSPALAGGDTIIDSVSGVEYSVVSVALIAGGSVLSVTVSQNYAIGVFGGSTAGAIYAKRSISSSQRTLTVTRHNYVAGEKFLVDTENKLINISPVGRSFLVLDIESVTATTITFTSASIGSYSFYLADGSLYYTEYPVDIRSQVHIYSSASADTGYAKLFSFVLDNSVTLYTRTTVLSEPVISLNALYAIPLEDIYDSTTLKIMPPICKHIASYGNQIIYGSVTTYFTTFTQALNAPNQRIQYTNDDIIIYSDVSSGDGPENTSELNRQKIGETYDGSISGLRRVNDLLVILKTRGVFGIDGTLVQGQYTLRKLSTNNVGCTGHKSILATDDGLFFQGHNGIYITNGISVKKVTDEIDSSFVSGLYPSTRSCQFKKKQKALFYVPELSKVVVIDYYYNQIYFWNNIVATSAFYEDANGDVCFSNGSKLFKFNLSLYSDDGAAYSKYYTTTWHHCGEPSLNKKFLSIRTFALTADQFTATITSEGDWIETTLTTSTHTYAAATQTNFTMIPMQTKRSLRFKFANNAIENMVITGYEITWEPFNGVDKN